MSTQLCPYCHREIAPKGGRHVHACLSNPALLKRTRAALNDGTGAIRRKEDYSADHPLDTPGSTTLVTQFGPWPAVAAAFGLVYPRTEKEAGRKQQPLPAADVDQVAEQVGRKLDRFAQQREEIRTATIGFVVARVREDERFIYYEIR